MGSEEYFARSAEQYTDSFKGGILGIVRHAEERIVMKHLLPKKGETVLDIPCGSGYYAECIVALGATVFGVDISREMIAAFKKKGFLGEVGALKNFCLKRQFDKVLSAGGFEFCKDHDIIMSNLLRHVKKNGKVVILVPRFSFFGILYRWFHKIMNKTKIVLFTAKDIDSFCKNIPGRIVKREKCSLFSFVVVVERTE